LVSLQVCRRRPQHIGPILELPEAEIALTAQQSPDLPGGVIVVDMCIPTHWSNHLSTHRTPLTLPFNDRMVLIQRQSIRMHLRLPNPFLV